jgi:hypothetical protein
MEKLYVIEYGNGFNGYSSNLGKELVLSKNVKSARTLVAINKKIPIKNVGKATQISFLHESTKNK